MTELLVARRCDIGGLRMVRQQIDDFVNERGYAAYLGTSAISRSGGEELKQVTIDGISWKTSP